MLRFEEINYAYLLVLIPILVLAYKISRQQNTSMWKQLGNPLLLVKYLYAHGKLVRFRQWILFIVFILLIISLVNPQMGKKKEKSRSQNIDVFITLDVSQSMLCTDIQPDRLSRAQIWIKQFIHRFPSERMGFISFAGSAYLHSPLTTDLATLLTMSASASPKNLGTQGTAIAEAIALAEKSFADEEGFHKVILLISDGEDHEGEIDEQVRSAKQKGITIFCIPVGTDLGSQVPSMYREYEQFRKDNEGNVVISKSNMELMKKIAEDSGGELIGLDSGEEGFELMKKRFSNLSRKEITYQSFSSYRSGYQYFLFFAFVLLCLETYWKRSNNEQL